ncbi:MAG: tetratricopeptide repeat protein, partial [Candidatus Obscuribacterales bacterium]|nr:tetratricopeptide repeat protein [Candidatus Obscuribacterales bacterium]
MDKSDTPELQFETSYTDALESRSRGDFATAAKLFRTALALARSFGEADERVYNSLLGLARCHYRLGNREQAEEHYRHALRIMENQIGDDHPNRFASVLWELAILYTDQSRFKEATLFFKQAILMTSNSAGPQDRFVADCLWGMSKCLCALGQLPDAERAIREAIAIYEATGDDVSEFVLTNQNNLVSVLIEQLKFSQAIAEVEKAIAILSRPDPSQPANKTAEIANNLCQLAWCQQRLNDFEKAGRTLKKALKITRAHDGPGSIRT